MPYEPRKRNGTKIKIIFAVIVLVIASVFVVSSFTKEEETSYQISTLSATETKKMLETEAKHTYTLSDYFFYGECLNILKDAYDPSKNDDIFGKSILLKEASGKHETAFVVGTSVDASIQLSHLEEGFYEIYIMEDLVEKKAVFKDDVNVSIKTTPQNDARYKVTLLASEAYFKERNIQPKENYAYLQVEKVKMSKDEYDIAIDPSALDRDFNIWSVNLGSKGNDLEEYKESYVAAELLKAALEEKGYKAIIVREEENERNSYGEDGRLKAAYDAKCKYYLRLCFSESAYDYSGFDIAYSARSSNIFASQIVYHLERNSDVPISTLYSGTKNKGVYRCSVLEGKDGRKIYDGDLWVREAGGKATQAGKYSDNAKEGTSFFAEDNIYGMNALDIRLGYLTSSSDATYWKENKKAFMQELANAIAGYLNTGK